MLDIEAIRAIAAALPTLTPVAVPPYGSLSIRRMSVTEALQLAEYPTAPERLAFVLRTVVVEPPLTDLDITAILNAPDLALFATTLMQAVNTLNTTTQPLPEAVATAHAAFRA